MYCENCGQKNVKKANFCEKCGKKLKKEIVVKPNAKEIKPEKKKKSFLKLGIILVLIITALVLIFFYSQTAKSVAKRYFTAYMSGDESAYNYLNIEKTEFTSKEIFEELFDEENELLNYRVVSENVAKDNLSATVMINYTLKSNNKLQTKKIYLKRDKKLSFWKVENEDFVIIDEKEIIAPKNAKIYLEDVLVSSKYLKDSDENDTYIIPNVFKGEYEVTLVLENKLTLEGDVVINSRGVTNLNSLSVKDESFEKEVLKNVNSIYEKAFNNEDEDISGFADLKEEKTKENVSDFKLGDVDFLDTEIKENLLYVSLKVNYEYTYTYSLFGKEKEKTKDESNKIILVFDYENNVYELKEIII